ncbi:MAG: 30S ribosomal protein S6 [Thermoanaerobaculia bacterium]
MSSYELAVLFDPRLSDEETANLSDGVKDLLTSLDAQIAKEESWGKKRLAYPIQKLNEARYVFYTVETGGANPFPEVEQRLEQNDKVLRYMTVRLDAGRLRHRGTPEAQAAPEAQEEKP